MPLKISGAPLTTTHTVEKSTLRAPVGVPLTEWIELRESRFRARMGKRQGNRTGASSTDRQKYPPSVSRTSFSRSIDSRSADSTTMRQDAREIFDEYGITRPEGWLSEANSGGDDENRIHHPNNITYSYRVCHSCRLPIGAGKECPTCGHDSCIKCTSEMPLNYPPLSDPLVHSHTTTPQDPLRTPVRTPRNDSPSPQSIERPGPQALRKASTPPRDRGSTPRPERANKIHEDLAAGTKTDDRTMIRKKTVVKVGNSVRNNPFVQADRSAKAFVSNPQASNEQAHAIQPYRLSDCVPRRGIGRSSSQSSVQKTSTMLDSPTAALIYDETYHGTNHTGIDKLALQTKVPEDPVVIESFKQRNPSERHEPTSSDPLQRKIEQLYQHAEDLNRSQHIMDHLAAGTRKLDRHVVPQRGTGRLISQPAPRDMRLHSMDNDEKEYVSHSGSGHDIFEDSTTTIAGNSDVHRVHSLPADRVERTESLFPNHNLADDLVPNPQSNPDFVHSAPQEFAPTEEPKSEEYTRILGHSRPSHTLMEEMSSQKSKPDGISDFSGAISRSHYVKSTTNLPKVANEKPSTYQASSSSLLQGTEQSGAESDQRMDASHRFITPKKYERQEPYSPYPHLPEEAYIDSWPKLKKVGRPTMEKTQHDAESTAPWAKNSLRRVTEDPEVHALHHDPGNASLVKMRQHLRRVERLRNDESPKPQTTPPLEWGRSLSRLTRTPQTQGEKEYDCGMCNPSQEPSLNNDEPTVSLAVEEVDAGRQSQVALPGPSTRDFRQPREEWLEQTPSRLKLRDLENSLARHSAEELLKDQAERRSAERATRTPKRTLKEVLGKKAERPKIRNPKPFLPPDHACEWRARCMDLNSEVEQLKSEMNSHEDTSQATGSLRVGRIDVGVGDALARHECDEFGIEGLTIVLHMRGKDDLVINTDLEKDYSGYRR
ncbi:unnamed protein product [Clonostachys byssicola]|uniref:Uncharacterized protein n=1 Tax=Clonostachys byssicola TaxID=160290 RepID=A0A9N9UU01_9HYPO|nr:unnamed protein product [Clonostachys byssicola]